MILAPVASIEPGAHSTKRGGGVILPPDPFRTFHILIIIISTKKL